jgi:HlyD family secretion protein
VNGIVITSGDENMKILEKKSLIVGLVLLLLVGAALWYFLGNRNQALYQTATIDRGMVRASVSATGNCNAVVTVQVGSQVSGNIKALYADFNTKVKKGQLVAEIDPQAFQARVDQAKASLDAARAAVVSAKAQVEKANADIASARANAANENAAIAKAKAAEQDASNKLVSRKSLFQQGILSKDDFDTAQSTYDQAVAEQQAAAAQLDAGNHQIQSMQAMYDVATTGLASAQSQVKENQAALEQAQLDLDHTRILAPVDGTVIARQMDVGQTVAASFQAPTIFQIAQDLTKMQVDTNVDEADVGVVKLNQPATFTVDAYPATIFKGSVTQIRQAPINVQNVITYDIVVGVDNSALKLLPGMTANVKILTAQADDVLKVPNAALRFRPLDAKSDPAAVRAAGKKQDAGSTVWILDENGKPKSIKVKLGISDGNFTAVDASDLKAGEQVIVGNLFKAQGSSSAPRTPTPGPRF